ncbi:hypothetical protein [Promicromonospora sp. NFX87]|uniref:hypothetical protein n=1 Tax=Promicromonospora sp. NFX87 TaxID=3402691 RepID=UPI003AFB16A0
MVDDGEVTEMAGVPTVDTSHTPRGERAARALVDAVAAGDDRLENYSLEIKGTLDLTGARDRAKLAKFILGAANRMPDKAAKAFGGYAVMVIGVMDGQVVGASPVENLDIEKAVTPYIGADGPAWELIRVRVSSGNDVLLLIVDPPQWGQPPFPCYKDGEGLVDGDVYVRTDGETRKAKSGEIKELSRRATVGASVAVGFDVDVVGEVIPVVVDTDATLEAYLAAETRRLRGPLPVRARETTGADGAVGESPGRRRRVVIPEGMLENLANLPEDEFARRHQSGLEAAARAARRTEKFAEQAAGALGLFMEPESRSEGEYRAEVSDWRTRFRAAWPEAREQLLGMRLAAVAPRVVNREEVFLHDVELVVHLEGDVRGVEADPDHDSEPHLHRLGLPRSPRKWGPKQSDLMRNIAAVGPFPVMPTMGPYVPQPRMLNWDNTGSVTLTFEIGDLRPRATHVCPDSDLILVVDDPSHEPIRGTWEITARGHHKVYAGELSVPIGAAVDLTPEFMSILGLHDREDGD